MLEIADQEVRRFVNAVEWEDEDQGDGEGEEEGGHPVAAGATAKKGRPSEDAPVRAEHEIAR